jgi:hypothetical protein
MLVLAVVGCVGVGFDAVAVIVLMLAQCSLLLVLWLFVCSLLCKVT